MALTYVEANKPKHSVDECGAHRHMHIECVPINPRYLLLLRFLLAVGSSCCALRTSDQLVTTPHPNAS